MLYGRLLPLCGCFNESSFWQFVRSFPGYVFKLKSSHLAARVRMIAEYGDCLKGLSRAIAQSSLTRGTDWKIPKVDWDQCPDLLAGLDKWSHPTSVSSATFHLAARLSTRLRDGRSFRDILNVADG